MHTAAVEQDVAQQRHERERNDERRGQQRHDRDAELLEDHAGHAAGQADRQEYGHGRQRGCGNRQHDLLGAQHTGVPAVIAIRPVMEDVFKHDNRVIHDHADAQRNTAERHHVKRDVKYIHNQEGEQDATRHRDRNRDRCANVAQEHDQHDRREQHAHPDVGHGVVHRHIDVIRLVHDQIPVERLVFGGQAVQLGLGALGDLDRVGPRLLVDRQQQALLAVYLGDRVLILRLQRAICDLV